MRWGRGTCGRGRGTGDGAPETASCGRDRGAERPRGARRARWAGGGGRPHLLRFRQLLRKAAHGKQVTHKGAGVTVSGRGSRGFHGVLSRVGNSIRFGLCKSRSQAKAQAAGWVPVRTAGPRGCWSLGSHLTPRRATALLYNMGTLKHSGCGEKEQKAHAESLRAVCKVPGRVIGNIEASVAGAVPDSPRVASGPRLLCWRGWQRQRPLGSACVGSTWAL